MSDDSQIVVKLGPFIKRSDGGEYLPLDLAICGRSVTWIAKELKKCENDTFVFSYEFASYTGNQAADESRMRTSACVLPLFAPEVSSRLEGLSIEEQSPVKPVAGVSRVDFAKPGTSKDASEKEQQSDQKTTTEEEKEEENVESKEDYPKPTFRRYLKHTEPVSAVAVYDEWILVGCLDGSLHIWTIRGKHRVGIRGHKKGIEDVAWLSMKRDTANFVSTSRDETVVIWSCNVTKNTVISRTICTHDNSGLVARFDMLSVNYGANLVAAGGWDATIRFWSTANPGPNKHNKYPVRKTRDCLKTIKAHRNLITGLVWSDKTEIISCSLDESMKIWDYESGNVKHVLTDHDCFYKVDYSPLRRSVVASTHDEIILYDLRSTASSRVGQIFNRHSDPVRSLRWSTVDRDLFIVAGERVKLWDTRNPKTPLFELHHHHGEVLCCDWSNPKFLAFGGQDKTLRIYKTTHV
nr:ribosome biogenesis protein WDR12 homolog isoform X1 [Megalopta genalis]XP_033327782.1 ribosome biogenesis protein WDR12 homolog isoform X1 [Megalopta genalis]